MTTLYSEYFFSKSIFATAQDYGIETGRKKAAYYAKAVRIGHSRSKIVCSTIVIMPYLNHGLNDKNESNSYHRVKNKLRL